MWFQKELLVASILEPVVSSISPYINRKFELQFISCDQQNYKDWPFLLNWMIEYNCTLICDFHTQQWKARRSWVFRYPSISSSHKYQVMFARHSSGFKHQGIEVVTCFSPVPIRRYIFGAPKIWPSDLVIFSGGNSNHFWVMSRKVLPCVFELIS